MKPGASARNVARGFTLTELLVILCVVAVLAGLGMPAYSRMMRSLRTSTDLQSLTLALTYARSEAIKRNTNVCVTANSNWSSGWIVKASTGAADPTCTAAGGQVLRNLPAIAKGASMSVRQDNADITSIAFIGSGERRGNEITIDYRSQSGKCNPVIDRWMIVGPSGRTRTGACT